MTIGNIGGVNYYNYSRINSVSPVEEDAQVKKIEKVENSDQNDSRLAVTDDNRKLLDTKKVVDFAVNGDMNTNRELIGSEADIEGLDIKKAISDMQKDSIIQEYQFFVQDPESLDGTVIKKN